MAKNGAYLGLPALLAFCSALLGKSLKGGLIAVGGLNPGGGLDPVYNAVNVAELAIEKGIPTYQGIPKRVIKKTWYGKC
jgi:ATP-dependent Lon protease